jgi:hypothetical protein
VSLYSHKMTLPASGLQTQYLAFNYTSASQREDSIGVSSTRCGRTTQSTNRDNKHWLRLYVSPFPVRYELNFIASPIRVHIRCKPGQRSDTGRTAEVLSSVSDKRRLFECMHGFLTNCLKIISF